MFQLVQTLNYFATQSRAELLANGPTRTCTGRSPLTAGAWRFTCMSPTNAGAIPAKGTGAEALPIVAVVVGVSYEKGLDSRAAPEAIGLFRGPLTAL
jgi:hypothetical protein